MHQGYTRLRPRQFATFDASAFAGQLDELADMTSLLSRVGRSGLEESGPWLTGLAGRRDHAGDGATTLDRSVMQAGVAFGYSGNTNEGTRWGVVGGYGRGYTGIDSSWARSGAIDSDNWFAGLSGDRTLGAVRLYGSVVGGGTSRSGTRFVNDNLALTDGLTLGEGSAEASFMSLFVAPEVGISVTLEAAGWMLTPAARLRYAGQWTGGYTETGSAANASVGGLSIGVLEANAELSLTRSLGFGTASVSVGYELRQSVGDDVATVTLLDVTNSVDLAATRTEAAYVGIALGLQPAPGVTVNFDGTGYFGDRPLGAQASAELAVEF